MQLSLNAFARKLTDCFVPRNDKVHCFNYKDKLSYISKNTTFSVILRIILIIDMKKENIKTAKLSSKTDETISISQKKAIEMGKILLSSNLSQLDRFLNR